MDRSKPSRRVLSPAVPFEGESLVGLARACAWENRLPSLGVLLRDSVEGSHCWGNLALRDDVDTARLAAAMAIPETEITARMHPGRQLATHLPVRSFFGADVRAYDLRSSTRSFSPAALEIGSHHRALWHVGLLPFCLETGGMLIERCGRCGMRLEWGAAKPLTRCSHCGRPATTGVPATVDAGTLEAARLLFGPIDPHGPSRTIASANLHPDLAALPPGAATDLGWSLGRVACGLTVERRRNDHRLTAEARTAVIRSGAAMLAEWPDGPRKHLRRLAASDATDARKMQRGLRAMCECRVRWPEQHELFVRRLPDLIEPSRKALSRAHGRALDGASSLPILKMAARLVPRLVEAGAVGVVEARRGRRLVPLLEAGSVEALARVRADCLPFGAAAERLGVSHAGVEQLCEAGLLREHVGPSIAVMYSDRQVSRAAWEALTERLLTGGTDGLEQAGTIAIARAACRFGGADKPWGAILIGLTNGTIPYIVENVDETDGSGRNGRRHRSLMRRLRIRPLDILAAQGPRSGIRPSGRERDGDGITRRDAQEILNLTPKQLGDAIEQELCEAVLPNGRLVRSRVMELAVARISPAEVSVRFEDGAKRTSACLRAAGIVRLGPSGWSRADVESVLVSGPGWP